MNTASETTLQSSGRGVISIALGVLTGFALFWFMQTLISMSIELQEGGNLFTVEFVRLRKDRTPEVKKREPPKREKPEQQPPPPEMKLAKVMNPSAAVGDIIPIGDIGMQLEEATSLGSGVGRDSGVTPLVRIDPEYPPRAHQQGIEGYVDLEFTITAVGTVKDVIVIAAEPSIVFDRAALRAVRRWRYSPKTENGVAVERPGIQVRIRFEIQKGR